MRVPKVTVVDFETEAIELRPEYPPKPVGVAVKLPGRKAKYYAWGHPTGNNCSRADGARVVNELWASGDPLLFHNGKFDQDVAETHFGVAPIGWERAHDTMFLLFLMNPHARELGLKPSAEKLLGMPPEEQDAIVDWARAEGLIARNAKKAGHLIAQAPGDLVGPYAIGDVVRTEKIFDVAYAYVKEHGMLAAYDRERRLQPILLRNERRGLRVDVAAIERDLPEYEAAIAKADAWIRKRLKVKELNIDSNEELADALEAAGFSGFHLTEKGGVRSVGKDSLNAVIATDKQLLSVIGYRSRMSTCVNTFLKSWLEKASSSGSVYPTWHQVRNGTSEKDRNGARTGRIICTDPNLLNLSKSFEDKNDGYVHPTFLRVPPLPLVRKYMLPDKNHVWCHRDYNQQELRILAHYEDDELCAAYGRDPKLDVHNYVKTLVDAMLGRPVDRRYIKTLNFGMIYGMGLGTLAERCAVEVSEAKSLRDSQRRAIPGLGDLERSIKQTGRAGEAIRTWGGREYYAEPPKVVDGRRKTYEYKLLNYLIQGSAADCTKEAIIRHDEVVKDERFLVTVYDEVNISSPKRDVKGSMARLREVMQSIEFDVPMLSDGKTGPTWGALEKFNEA